MKAANFREGRHLLRLADAAFDQLRQAGARHPAILVCIADTLGSLAPASAGGEARRPLLAQLAKLEETAQRGALVCSDRQDVATRIAQARAALLS
jgi:uncharacterized membrane protein